MTVEAPVAASGLDRRRFVQLAGLSGAALLAGCRSSSPLGDRRPLRLGYVSPQSGSLFAFGEADNFVISSAQQTFKDGLEIGGRAYPVEILVRDSQSDPERAGEVAAALITGDQVDLMLVSSTPETTNPVADACERSGVPCISTVTPYQPWFLARDPPQDPRNPEPYHWTWHFFWGLEDIIGVFSDMWGQVENNQVLGGLWPDAGELAQEYTRATGRQWTQPIGFVHALFEVAADVLRRAGDVSDRQALVDAIKATSLNTIVGRVSWAKSQADFPNVARTPLVGGQWRRGRTWPFELEIVSNATHPEIPASSTLQPIA